MYFKAQEKKRNVVHVSRLCEVENNTDCTSNWEFFFFFKKVLSKSLVVICLVFAKGTQQGRK